MMVIKHSHKENDLETFKVLLKTQMFNSPSQIFNSLLNTTRINESNFSEKSFKLYQTKRKINKSIPANKCMSNKSIIETLKGAFMVNFKHISQLVLVFLLLTLNR